MQVILIDCTVLGDIIMIFNHALYIGCIFYYGLLHVLLFWFMYVSILFYKVALPFESRLIELYSKRLHLGVVLVAVTLPCFPIIVAFSTGGFLSIGYPQLVCVFKNSNAEHYSYTLPYSVIIATGISLLVVVATIIFKVKVNNKAIHRY